jgi:NDP-sugar pyrophosphorylase family protein
MDRLCGRCIERAGGEEFPEIEWAQPAPEVYTLAFAGIHVLSPLIFEKMEEQGAFSIIDAYLNLASQGEKIVAFWADEYYWRDLGRPENLLEAAQDVASGKYSIS